MSGKVYPFNRGTTILGADPAHDERRVRTPLWELPAGALCPVVGSCLGIDPLRRLLNELFQGTSQASDIDLHAAVVRECAVRNKVSEAIQQELDRLHAETIEQLEPLLPEQLAELWQAAIARCDIAGTLWAVLTHPRCPPPLPERLLQDVHMLQHHAVATLREERRLNAQLAADNELLHRLLGEQAASPRLDPAPPRLDPTSAATFRAARWPGLRAAAGLAFARWRRAPSLHPR